MQLLICLLSLLQFLVGEEDVSLLFAGDAMQHDRQIAAARKGDSYDYSQCFRYVDDYIREADYAVVNFECTLGGKPYKGYPCFSAPDEYAVALQNAGFDLFLTANNHCLDTRDAGLKRTLSQLDDRSIPHLGTYRNAEERNRNVPFIANVKGMRIAFLNYTYGTNGIEVQGDVVVNYISRHQIQQDLDATKKLEPDLIVACMHWGEEYKLFPNTEQENLADFLVENGVDLVIGGHPHVVQPMEVRHDEKRDKDVLVVYSLGNFISAMRTNDTRGGATVKVVLDRSDGKPTIKKAGYKLFFVQPPAKVGDNYVLVPEDSVDLVQGESKKQFSTFMRRAHQVFSKNINVPAE